MPYIIFTLTHALVIDYLLLILLLFLTLLYRSDKKEQIPIKNYQFLGLFIQAIWLLGIIFLGVSLALQLFGDTDYTLIYNPDAPSPASSIFEFSAILIPWSMLFALHIAKKKHALFRSFNLADNKFLLFLFFLGSTLFFDILYPETLKTLLPSQVSSTLALISLALWVKMVLANKKIKKQFITLQAFNLLYSSILIALLWLITFSATRFIVERRLTLGAELTKYVLLERRVVDEDQIEPRLESIGESLDIEIYTKQEDIDQKFIYKSRTVQADNFPETTIVVPYQYVLDLIEKPMKTFSAIVILSGLSFNIFLFTFKIKPKINDPR